jgi:hypothetical protein
MPKGVVWQHVDVFMALGGGIDPMTNERAARPEYMVEKAKAGVPLTFLPIAPLMHGATQWAVMGQSFLGNKVVLMGKFDANGVWDLVHQWSRQAAHAGDEAGSSNSQPVAGGQQAWQ